MKKSLFTIIGIVLVLMLILTLMYYNYRKTVIISEQKNLEFEIYTKTEILGSSLMTLINKAIDYNEKNEVEKDKKNVYIENDTNSIKIEIKFIESDKTYTMESISSLGSEQFVKNYTNMTFKCNKVEYHTKTKHVKYMLFEQI